MASWKSPGDSVSVEDVDIQEIGPTNLSSSCSHLCITCREVSLELSCVFLCHMKRSNRLND